MINKDEKSPSVLICTNSTWSIFNFRLGFIMALQKRGFIVYALSPSDEYVERLQSIGVKHFHIDIDPKGTNPFKDLKLLRSFKEKYLQISPDVVLNYTIKPNIYSSLAASKLEIPVINNISGLGTLFITNSVFTIIAKLLYRFSLGKTTHTFFQNNDDASLFKESGLIAGNKFSIIPGSGVDVEKFKFERNTNKGLVFLFVGRLIADKGIKEYLEAVKKIIPEYGNIKFRIVGEIQSKNRTALDEQEFFALISKYPQIEYIGKTDDIISVLKNADVLVLPSYREGLSKSLIEACAMSLPIITTNVAGCRDVVTDGLNGLLCDVKNVDSLESSIREMISFSEQQRLELGKNGRMIAEKYFSEEFVIQAYLEIIEDVLAS